MHFSAKKISGMWFLSKNRDNFDEFSMIFGDSFEGIFGDSFGGILEGSEEVFEEISEDSDGSEYDNVHTSRGLDSEECIGMLCRLINSISTDMGDDRELYVHIGEIRELLSLIEYVKDSEDE